MTKPRTILSILLVAFASLLSAQSYQQMWAAVKQAADADQPRTALSRLAQIEERAGADKAYGHLFAAMLQAAKYEVSLSPDSVAPQYERMKRRLGAASDPVVRAICCAILAQFDQADLYASPEEAASAVEGYRRQAVADTAALAAARVADWVPLVKRGANGSVFKDDMLSVICYQTRDFAAMSSWYSRTSNRRAALIAALEEIMASPQAGCRCAAWRKCEAVRRIDSLTQLYGDLPIAGEAAVRRYEALCRCDDADTETRIAYIHTAVKRWGDWPAVNALRNAERELTATQVQVSCLTDATVRPAEHPAFLISDSRNIGRLTLSIYRTALTGAAAAGYDLSRRADKDKGSWGRPVAQIERQYASYPDYQTVSDTLRCQPLAAGVYVVQAKSSKAKKPQYALLQVSDLAIVTQPKAGGGWRVAVVSATTGQPAAGAKIDISQSEYRFQSYKHVKTATTDQKGETTVSRPQSGFAKLFAYTADDRGSVPVIASGEFAAAVGAKRTIAHRIYTDRALYRPGQEVKAAVVVFREGAKDDCQAAAGEEITLTLADANGKPVATDTLRTDAFGVCSASFTLPKTALTGSFSLHTDIGQRVQIRVEEYRRPTFRVEMPEVNARYAAGDTLMVTAHATSYAGRPVASARVRYQVRRREAFWWRCAAGVSAGNGDTEGVVASGETLTSADGTFTIPMPLVVAANVSAREARFYRFELTADVTDQGGETEAASLAVPLGTKPTCLAIDLPDKARRDQMPTMTIRLYNAAGLDIPAKAHYRIDGSADWTEAQTADTIALPATLASGLHKIEAACQGDTISRLLTVFSLDDTTPATDTRDWFYASASAFADDHTPVILQIGSSDPDLHILYNIASGKQIIEEGCLDLSRSLDVRRFVYSPDYADGLTLSYLWVKDGQVYRHTHSITRPQPVRRLTLRWATFRDRLTPGQHETWTLSATDADGRPADASILATLYDASLDQLAPHSLALTAGKYLRLPHADFSCQTAFRLRLSLYSQVNYLTVPSFEPNMIDPDCDFREATHHFAPVRYRGVTPLRRLMAKQAVVMEESKVAPNVMMAPTAPTEDRAYDSAAQEDAATGATSPTDEEILLTRANLGETALFAPQLRTDANGQATLSFTLPESLTTWRLLALAHTADMNSATIEARAVASKALMVQPYVPRFLRAGDKARLTAVVTNASEQSLAGRATLQLTDAATGKTVYQESRPFEAEADSAVAVTFTGLGRATANAGGALLVCRVIASADGRTDGEQHYLPVLPATERVITTASYYLHDAARQAIDLKQLFPRSATSRRLTIEHTDNPAYLALTALPAVVSTREEDAISSAAALYADALGAAVAGRLHLADRLPEAEDAASPLERNDELRDLPLSETPWISAAESENMQKRMLARFANPGEMALRRADFLGKLRKLQLPDGSWTWLPGMEGSVCVTTYIVKLFARLQRLGATDTDLQTLMRGGLRYLDSQLSKQVARMRQDEKLGHKQQFPGSQTLETLYIHAILADRLADATKRDIAYLLPLLKQTAKAATIETKALAAIVLAANGEKQAASQWVESIKQYTVSRQDLGRYFDTPKAQSSWCDYRMPTQVAAIEAVEQVAPDETLTAEMRQWILRQKQTRQWLTPVATTDAVYSLMAGETAATTDGPQTSLAIDGAKLDLAAQATAGAGYATFTRDAAQARTLTAERKTKGTSWGAVYAQYSVPQADVESQSNGLTVSRRIDCADKQPRVGSRVKVTITVKADRDMDFVVIADRRAACLEPTDQLSGYSAGAYCSLRDNTTYYYIHRLAKGRHTYTRDYYITRAGEYSTGTCTAACAYAPEYRATEASAKLAIDESGR